MGRPLTFEEYRLLVHHSPVMIWRSGLDAKCDYFNKTWLAFTGRTIQQEMGKGWAEGVHPDDLERCVSHYLDHFRQRQPFEMEYRLRRRDGVYRWIFDRGVPFMDDNGNFAGFIGSCVDVDERRRVQDTEQHRISSNWLWLGTLRSGFWRLSATIFGIRWAPSCSPRAGCRT